MEFSGKIGQFTSFKQMQYGAEQTGGVFGKYLVEERQQSPVELDMEAAATLK